MLAVFLVERIEDVVERGLPDQFLGLILLPLVEKAAEHLTAVDEAWDGQMVRWVEPCRRICTKFDRILHYTIVSDPQSRQRYSMPHWLSLLGGGLINPWISTLRFS